MQHCAKAITALFLTFFILSCNNNKPAAPLPDKYRQSGAFIKSLPYFNPDSCVMLIRRDVEPQWQGAAYENLFLDGPEDSPFELGFKHLDYYEKNFPADTARAFAQLWRGQLFIYQNKPDSARACLQESHEISLRGKHMLRASNAQATMADLYLQKGDIAGALRAYLANYELVKDLDPSQMPRKLLAVYALVKVYHEIRNSREALFWAKHGLALAANEDIESLRSFKVDLYSSAGVVYSYMNLVDSAILMHQSALDLQAKYSTINSRSSLLTYLGDGYFKKGDCQKSLRLLLEARQGLPAEHATRTSDLDLLLAKAYFCLGRLDSAEHYNLRCLKSPSVNEVGHARNNLGDIYAQKGRYREAWEMAHASLILREKNFNPEKVLELGAIKSQLELELTQRKLEQAQLEKKNALQHKEIIGLLLLLVASLGISLYFRQRARNKVLQQENRLLEKDKMLKTKEIEIAEARERLRNKELATAKTELEKSNTTLKTTEAKLEETARLLELKNQFVEELKLRMAENQPDIGSPQNLSDIRGMKILTSDDWSRFWERFGHYFPGFLTELKLRHPSLTAAEIRMFMLIKLGFDTRETAETLGISPDSVYRNRSRLGKKLGLMETSDLDAFVRQFSEKTV